MRHTIAVLVKDHPGVLARVASLFTRRGFNIESLAVGHTEENDISRMTIVVKGDERVLEQITKQLNKLIDVIRVKDISPQNSVERELALIKVNTNSLPARSEKCSNRIITSFWFKRGCSDRENCSIQGECYYFRIKKISQVNIYKKINRSIKNNKNNT